MYFIRKAKISSELQNANIIFTTVQIRWVPAANALDSCFIGGNRSNTTVASQILFAKGILMILHFQTTFSSISDCLFPAICSSE